MYDSTLTPLRLARVRTGAPQLVIAKRARLSPSRLSVLERGYDEPSSYERAALARVLSVAAEDLFPLPASLGPAAADGGTSN